METIIQQKLKSLPNKPGAYMMKDERGEVIYVGKAASLRNRVRSYFQKGQGQPARTLAMVSKIKDLDWLVTDTELGALMLECNLIKKYRPHYNVLLRDDKHYPYLCVTTSEPFPRVLVVRRIKQDGNKYFGPYVDAIAVRESLRIIRKIFRIRSCNKKLNGTEKDHPCLNLHLNQCESPCSGRISREDYAASVRDTCLLLEGHCDSLAERLNEEMTAASESLEFEQAAKLRDQLDAIRRIAEKQIIISTNKTDQDVASISVVGQSTCVQLMFIRSGKIVGQTRYYMNGTPDKNLENGLNEFIKQYYRDASYIPKEILLSNNVDERDIFESWLSEKRGSRVRIECPKRGEKRKLVQMALENAALAAEREQQQELENETKAAEDLDDLKKILGLLDIPHRIEAYDISNIQGKEAVGSMVIFENGVPAKSQYRRFKIRISDQPDDYMMIREVLIRRLRRADEGDKKFHSLPNLILIDGGRGQLNAALEVLQVVSRQSSVVSKNSTWEGEASAEPSLQSINIISLAKRLEEIYTTNSSNPLLLPRDSRALRLLQRIRDEAHRFALSYHHKLREKSVSKSILDSIPGIGEQRRKALIRKFGSVAGIRRASLEEIMSVSGMNQSTAQAVYDALNT